jgi:hypothetical protein
MFWLVYRRGSKKEIVIQPAAHVIMARMKVAMAGYRLPRDRSQNRKKRFRQNS